MQEQKQIFLNVPVNNNDNSELMRHVKVQEQNQIYLNAPTGQNGESGDCNSPTMNQYLVQAANKAMTSNENSIKQQQIIMPIINNGNKYEELKYQVEAATEEVFIPDEMPKMTTEQEIAHQLYYSQMNELYNGQQNAALEAFD